MNNKKFGIIMGIAGIVGVAIGMWSLFNSTYITNIGNDVSTTMFLSIRSDNQSLIIMGISLMAIVLGIVILLKKRI